ncbi:uncharacterized protein [Oryctolagus cuniculus]|uniref:uncharacterized protein n=1 Tax=Oryctolagus cuniculus TaxID=9986 RepID=UPI003877EF88
MKRGIRKKKGKGKEKGIGILEYYGALADHTAPRKCREEDCMMEEQQLGFLLHFGLENSYNKFSCEYEEVDAMFHNADERIQEVFQKFVENVRYQNTVHGFTHFCTKRRIKGAWPRARGSAFLRVGRGRVSVRSGPRLATAETRAGRLDAPSAAALSVQDGVPAGESVQHTGGTVPRHGIIGEFTTSYRELSRGQSQFNVYEVTLLSFLVQMEVSFLDYIKGGRLKSGKVPPVAGNVEGKLHWPC